MTRAAAPHGKLASWDFEITTFELFARVTHEALVNGGLPVSSRLLVQVFRTG